MLSLGALASALTVLAHPVYFALDGLIGIPNLARLLGHSCIVVTSWAVQSLLLHLNYDRAIAQTKTRQLGVVMLVALGLMTLLFGLAPVDEETIQFMSRYADAPYILQYWLIFLSYLAVALVNVVRLDLAYATRTDNPSMKIGLRTVAFGATVGLGYVANESLYVVGRRIGLGYPFGDKDMVTTVLVAGGTSLMIIGSTMPAWGPAVGIPRIWHWSQRYWMLRRLYPLWSALYAASPSIALSPPSSSVHDVFSVGDVNIRLHRRVIEIRDGLLTLRPFVDPRVGEEARRAGRATGLAGDELAAVSEAATIANAIGAKARGEQPGDGDMIMAARGGSTMIEEAAFLTRVAQAQHQSPVVRAVLERFDHDAAGRRCR